MSMPWPICPKMLLFSQWVPTTNTPLPRPQPSSWRSLRRTIPPLIFPIGSLALLQPIPHLLVLGRGFEHPVDENNGNQHRKQESYVFCGGQDPGNHPKQENACHKADGQGMEDLGFHKLCFFGYLFFLYPFLKDWVVQNTMIGRS